MKRALAPRFGLSLRAQGSLSFGMDLFDVYPAMSWLITVFGPMLQVRLLGSRVVVKSGAGPNPM